MNTKSWAELLRHFLFLFIFIDVAAGIVIMNTSKRCLTLFKTQEVLPIGLPVPHHPIEISVDTIFIIMDSIGLNHFVVSCIGLVGICVLNRYAGINFTFGIVMMNMMVLFFLDYKVLLELMQSYNHIVEDFIVSLFESVNTYNVSKFFSQNDASDRVLNKWERNNPLKIYNLNFTKEGWSMASEGGSVNQTYVDLIQTNIKCCGLTDRGFWNMRIPRSCCDDMYLGSRCTLSVAYERGCLFGFHKFRDCVFKLRIEIICFGFITLLSALDSLYLAYLKMHFPDGDYHSDESSDIETARN